MGRSRVLLFRTVTDRDQNQNSEADSDSQRERVAGQGATAKTLAAHNGAPSWLERFCVSTCGHTVPDPPGSSPDTSSVANGACASPPEARFKEKGKLEDEAFGSNLSCKIEKGTACDPCALLRVSK